MARYLPFGRKRQWGFSLIDLLASMLIASILLVGVYKAFLSNIQHSSDLFDISMLDDKTKRIVTTIQADISELNGNIINGVPTIFPLFFDSSDIKGFVLFKANKSIPILKMSPPSFAPPVGGATNTMRLENNTLSGQENSVIYQNIKPGMFATIYNYANYSWNPLKIEEVLPVSDDPGRIDLVLKDIPVSANNWTGYLKTSCTNDFKFSSSDSDMDEVCVTQAGVPRYQRANTAVIINESVEYFLEGKKLYRSINRDPANPDNPSSKILLADGVSVFEVSFSTKENTIYPQAKPLITNKTSIRNFMRSLIPGNNQSYDDCVPLYDYKCRDKSGNLTKAAYAILSSKISGINVNLKTQTEEKKDKAGQETQKSKLISFYMTLDSNRGNSALNIFSPTKIVATENDTLKPLGSQTALPSFNNVDPMGGGLGILYTAAVPMKDVVIHNEDDETDQIFENICESCYPNCGDGYPPICRRDLNDDGIPDFRQCRGANAATRYQLQCLSPQGSNNDRGLNSSSDQRLNNQINPKLVLIDNNANIRFEYDLSRNCTSNCLADNIYYRAKPQFEDWTDSLNPLSVYTHIDRNTGLPDRFYVGMSRTRWPSIDINDWGGVFPNGQNYEPFFHSHVLAINPGENLSDPSDDSATWVRTLHQDYPYQPGSIQSLLAELRAGDIDQVSAIDMIYSGNYEYMYLMSTSANRISYRKRPAGSTIDLTNDPQGWTEIRMAFEDRSELYPVKFSMKVKAPDGNDVSAVYPFYAIWGDRTFPSYEHPRIAAMHVSETEERIYYCTAQALPSHPIDSQGCFYQNTISYKSPITDASGITHACDPTIEDGSNSHNSPACTIPAGVPKPIDPMNDAARTPGGACFGNVPLADSIRENYTASLKVAIKNGPLDQDWTIKKIADLNGQCTGIKQAPSGDILLASSLNIKMISYEELNYLIARNEEGSDTYIPKINLGRKSGEFYAANNILSALASKDPPSPAQNIEVKKLAGINVYPHHGRLNIVFSDAYSKIVGYIFQENNPHKDMLFVQIVANHQTASRDSNLDFVSVFAKGEVDRREELTRHMLPWNTDKVWADWARIGENDEALYPVPPPTQVRPPRWINDYFFDWNDQQLTAEQRATQGGTYKRKAPYGNWTNCPYDPSDPRVSVAVSGGGTRVDCGQSRHYKACEGDAYAGVNQSIQAGQVGWYGCGLPYPNYESEPAVIPAPPREDDENAPIIIDQ